MDESSKKTTAFSDSHRTVSSAWSNLRLFLALLGSVFVGETVVMLFLDTVLPLTHWGAALLDASLLVLLIFPSVYFFVIRPMNNHWALNKSWQEEQQELVDRLQKIASLVPGVVFQFQLRPDGSFCFPYASVALRDIYHVDPKAVRDDASKVFAVIHPDDVQSVTASMMASAENLSPWRHEYRVQFDDVGIRWLLGHSIPERQSDGSILWHGFITDITERKAVEDTLRFHSIILNSLSEGICLVDVNDGCFVYTNPKFEHLFGYGLGELIGMPVSIINAPGDISPQAMAIAMMDELHKTGVWNGEIQTIKKDGTTFWCYANISTISHPQYGRVWVSIHNDITGHKCHEAALRSSDEAHRSILAATLDGFCVVSPEGRLLDVNNRYAVQSGFTREELLTLSIYDLEAVEAQHDTQDCLERIKQKGSDQFETIHRRKDGSSWHVEVSVMYLDSNGGKYFGFLRDISERKAAEEKIQQLAFYDPLTQLPNRRMLDERMAQMLAHGQRAGDLTAICMLDLDGFKRVNDTLGHKSGDLLLREVAVRLRNTIRLEDTVARLGGDEFVLVLGGFNKANEYEQTLKRIIAQLAMPYSIKGNLARVSASMGVSLFPTDAQDPDSLLRYADQSMYEAKASGKNCYHLFDPTRGQRQQASCSAIEKIAKALAENQIVLYYQPIVDCRLGKVVGAEALLRWNHPMLGLLESSEFIPVITDNEALFALADWMLCSALQQLHQWREAGIDIRVCVNLFARQLFHDEFTTHLNQLLMQRYPNMTDWKGLEIEIGEVTALENIDAVSLAIREIRTMGISVTLDDFGVGYSSLVHLKRLPVSALKIDSSLISHMLTDSQELLVVDGVVNLAASFRLEVIAMGVDSIEQLLLLKDLGCNLVQGNCIASPMPLEHFTAWLDTFSPDPLWSVPKSQRPSRDYFELLLAEANHPYWIDQVLADTIDSGNPVALNRLGDDSQCRFGQWYHLHGMERLHFQNEFSLLDTLHKNIHMTAVRLSRRRSQGHTAEARAEETALLRQQKDFTNQLRRLRLMLADDTQSAS